MPDDIVFFGTTVSIHTFKQYVTSWCLSEYSGETPLATTTEDGLIGAGGW